MSITTMPLSEPIECKHCGGTYAPKKQISKYVKEEGNKFLHECNYCKEYTLVMIQSDGSWASLYKVIA